MYQGNSAPNLCHTSHETRGAAPHTSPQCRKESLRDNKLKSDTQGNHQDQSHWSWHFWMLRALLESSTVGTLRSVLCTLSVYVTQSTHHPSDLLPTAMCDFYPAFSKCPPVTCFYSLEGTEAQMSTSEITVHEALVNGGVFFNSSLN